MSSQEQPRRSSRQEPIKYGDVFDVRGDLAAKPVAPRDAAMMQSAENTMLGQTQKGAAAAAMQSAADKNEQAGLVGHGQATDTAADRGVSLTETDVPGRRVVTEAIGDQVVGQYNQPTPLRTAVPGPTGGVRGQPVASAGGDAITIGEALEATAVTAGDKPVERSDAAAIQAAEIRATGRTGTAGVGAAAQSAATVNQMAMVDEDKTKLGEILSDATEKLPSDKPATRGDAEGVTSAELRNDPNVTTRPGGVAASVTAAARLNRG